MDHTEKIAWLRSVTWEEIEDWAGATIAKRGQGYHRDGRVHDLAHTDDGELLAWVHGTARYATLVDYDEGGLVSACTCPYGATCKHAVAVVQYRAGCRQPAYGVQSDAPALGLRRKLWGFILSSS